MFATVIHLKLNDIVTSSRLRVSGPCLSSDVSVSKVHLTGVTGLQALKICGSGLVKHGYPLFKRENPSNFPPDLHMAQSNAFILS